MSERNKVVPDAMLSKEFLSQFKTEADVSKFLKQLHSQVLEKMLEGEMDVHLFSSNFHWKSEILFIQQTLLKISTERLESTLNQSFLSLLMMRSRRPFTYL